jgi:hypothetical protein
MPPHSRTQTSRARPRSRTWPVLVWIVVLALWVVVAGRSAAGPSLSFAAGHAYPAGLLVALLVVLPASACGSQPQRPAAACGGPEWAG